MVCAADEPEINKVTSGVVVGAKASAWPAKAIAHAATIVFNLKFIF
jgi:hypothetical protein